MKRGVVNKIQACPHHKMNGWCDNELKKTRLHVVVYRAIEEERSRQARERAAILKEEARRPRDKRAGKKRVEALVIIVACAIGVSRRQLRRKLRAERSLHLEAPRQCERSSGKTNGV